MKRLIISVILVAAMTGAIHAQTDLTEEDYKDFDKLRKKIVRMKKEMDRLMGDIISTYPQEGTSVFSGYGQDVKVDIAQDGKNFVVKADLPGMDKDKIEITLEKNRFLKISGARDVMKKETSADVVRQERMQGRFERVVELPGEARSDGINATYKNGVLEVVIPVKKAAKEEKVNIQVQ